MSAPSVQYSIAQASDRLPELVDQAEQGTPVELTRHGKRVAVILSAEE
jgi:prevent-host-death family protein